MQLSKRLTRAGAAFVAFGLVAAAVPNSAIMPAGACGGSSDNNTGAYIAGGVILAGGAYLLTVKPTPKTSTPSTPDTNPPANTDGSTPPATPASNSEWNSLHTFVYGE